MSTAAPVERRERGMVTAELALAVLASIFVLMIMCWSVALAVLQLRCMDTAAEVARQAARGDRTAMVRAQHDAPAGAEVTLTTTGDRVIVVVALAARPGGLRLPAVRLTAAAETLKEPE